MKEAGISDQARRKGLYEQAMRAAGASHGREVLSTEFGAMIEEVGRTPSGRTTVYGLPQREHSVG